MPDPPAELIDRARVDPNNPVGLYEAAKALDEIIEQGDFYPWGQVLKSPLSVKDIFFYPYSEVSSPQLVTRQQSIDVESEMTASETSTTEEENINDLLWDLGEPTMPPGDASTIPSDPSQSSTDIDTPAPGPETTEPVLRSDPPTILTPPSQPTAPDEGEVIRTPTGHEASEVRTNLNDLASLSASGDAATSEDAHRNDSNASPVLAEAREQNIIDGTQSETTDVTGPPSQESMADAEAELNNEAPAAGGSGQAPNSKPSSSDTGANDDGLQDNSQNNPEVASSASAPDDSKVEDGPDGEKTTSQNSAPLTTAPPPTQSPQVPGDATVAGDTEAKGSDGAAAPPQKSTVASPLTQAAEQPSITHSEPSPADGDATSNENNSLAQKQDSTAVSSSVGLAFDERKPDGAQTTSQSLALSAAPPPPTTHTQGLTEGSQVAGDSDAGDGSGGAPKSISALSSTQAAARPQEHIPPEPPSTDAAVNGQDNAGSTLVVQPSESDPASNSPLAKDESDGQQTTLQNPAPSTAPSPSTLSPQAPPGNVTVTGAKDGSDGPHKSGSSTTASPSTHTAGDNPPASGSEAGDGSGVIETRNTPFPDGFSVTTGGSAAHDDTEERTSSQGSASLAAPPPTHTTSDGPPASGSKGVVQTLQNHTLLTDALSSAPATTGGDATGGELHSQDKSAAPDIVKTIVDNSISTPSAENTGTARNHCVTFIPRLFC